MSDQSCTARYITMDEIEQDPDTLKMLLKIHKEILLVDGGVPIARLLPVDNHQDAETA